MFYSGHSQYIPVSYQGFHAQSFLDNIQIIRLSI